MERHLYKIDATKRNGQEISGFAWWDGLNAIVPVHTTPDTRSDLEGYVSMDLDDVEMSPMC